VLARGKREIGLAIKKRARSVTKHNALQPCKKKEWRVDDGESFDLHMGGKNYNRGVEEIFRNKGIIRGRMS